MDLKDKKFLITGGAGLIGSHICDLLAHKGAAEIVVLDDFSRGRHENLDAALEAGPVRVVRGDICDRRLLGREMEEVDVVFHQAAIRITRCAEEPRVAFDVLGAGTFNVVEAARSAGVGKIVAASTASVYGMAEEFPTDESHHPYGNRTLYGALKVFNEGLYRSFHDMYDLDYVALRYFNVYGPRMDVHGAYTEVMIRWMERILDGQPPLIFGDGKQTMDFIFVEDIARANVLAAESDAVDEVFNIASGTETSLLELARMLLEIMGRPDLEVEHREERKVNAVPRRLADTSKAAEKLGFRAEVDLRQGLERLVEWFLAARKAGRDPGAE